jgi:hypothetical protein
MEKEIKLKETLGPVMELKGRNGEVDHVQFVIVERATEEEADG